MTANKLVIVAGCPAAGKTTLAGRLGEILDFPVLSRDRVKETMLAEQGLSHKQAGKEINALASQAFFAEVNKRVRHQSLVIEAAFQHAVWQNFLEAFSFETRIIVCEVSADTAFDRFKSRQSDHRVHVHGDDLVAAETLIRNYKSPTLELPTLCVNTEDDYSPGFGEIVRFCRT